MNDEDKKRFARYKKGYIHPIDEYGSNDINNNKKNKIGFIDKIDVKMNVLVSDIIVSNNKNKL
jgi:hypothetical protein